MAGLESAAEYVAVHRSEDTQQQQADSGCKQMGQQMEVEVELEAVGEDGKAAGVGAAASVAIESVVDSRSHSLHTKDSVQQAVAGAEEHSIEDCKQVWQWAAAAAAVVLVVHPPSKHCSRVDEAEEVAQVAKGAASKMSRGRMDSSAFKSLRKRVTGKVRQTKRVSD
jgi:hypothetical protein